MCREDGAQFGCRRLNRRAVARMVYSPGMTFRNAYAPLSLVVVVRSIAVLTFVSMMCAFETAAPLGSKPPRSLLLMIAVQTMYQLRGRTKRGGCDLGVHSESRPDPLSPAIKAIASPSVLFERYESEDACRNCSPTAGPLIFCNGKSRRRLAQYLFRSSFVFSKQGEGERHLRGACR